MGRFEMFYLVISVMSIILRLDGFNCLIFMLQTLGSNGVCTYTFCHCNIFLVLQND